MTREDELMKRIEAGDGDAAEELAAMYYGQILRYCLWHAPDRTFAEDAAQETFLKAIQYFDRYVHRGHFKAFLYKVAGNVCADMRRRRWNAEVPLDGEELSGRPHGNEDSAMEDKSPAGCEAAESAYVEEGFDQAESALALRQMVAGLPPQQREVVILRFGQELTLREIAAATETPLRTVQSRLRAALKELRKRMEDGGERK